MSGGLLNLVPLQNRRLFIEEISQMIHRAKLHFLLLPPPPRRRQLNHSLFAAIQVFIRDGAFATIVSIVPIQGKVQDVARDLDIARNLGEAHTLGVFPSLADAGKDLEVARLSGRLPERFCWQVMRVMQAR